MTAARVDLKVDQGADFLVQVYWQDQSQTPMQVVGPMRMEIRTADTKQMVMALQVGSLEDDESYDLVYNTESGLIQIHISPERSKNVHPGVYVYDLFCGYLDRATDVVRRHKLIEGNLEVVGRVTQDV